MAGTHNLRRNKLACVSSKFITEAQSDQSLRCALYGYLVRASDNNCVQITQIDMPIRNFAWRTFNFLRNSCASINRLQYNYVCLVLTHYILYDPTKIFIESPLSNSISVSD